MILPDIPDELVEEILCRVPATSLKRLRSTCKQWKNLFNDTKFSRKHFDKAARQPVFVITKEHTLCSLSVNLHDGIPSAEVTGELRLNQVWICEVFHYDGLLLCTINSRSIVVWNPCTGQTKRIQTPDYQIGSKFVLGNYQDSKSCNKSYKILRYTSFRRDHQVFDIYDINSNSWRNLDVTFPIQGDMCYETRVSLKGKTYWVVSPRDSPVGLISFDYTTERFECLRLPYQCHTFVNYSISDVGDEKLSVLSQHENSSRSEVWITKKIDYETKEMCWSKLFEVEVGIQRTILPGRRFLVDEEKKIVVCCEEDDNDVITVSIVGADGNAGESPDEALPLVWSFPATAMPVLVPCLVNYVPSLIQI